MTNWGNARDGAPRLEQLQSQQLWEHVAAREPERRIKLGTFRGEVTARFSNGDAWCVVKRRRWSMSQCRDIAAR